MSTIGIRIRQARKRRGWSMKELADKAELSAMAISKFEKGRINPASDTLIRIARALDYGVEFFLRPIRIEEIQPSFRKKSSLSKKAQDRIIEDIRDWLERYLIAEELAPSNGILRFTYPAGFPRRVSGFDDVEKAANDLRRLWDIGSDPLESVTALLEDKGIKVGVVKADAGFDGCMFQATNDDDIPVVVTRKDLPGDRQRFSLAHELGHIMLDVKENPSSRFLEEKACHRFAAAFLAPAQTIMADWGERRSRIGIDELYVLKHKYGMSMAALLYRAKDLAVISGDAARPLWIRFRENGWYKEEPGKPVRPETRARFRLLVYQALAEDIISPKRAAELYKKDLTSVG